MKLFIKEHLLLIVMQCVQGTFIGLLLVLGGFNDYSLMLYGLIISVFFLFIYLIYMYVSRKNLYIKLSKRPTHVDQLLETTDVSPIGKAFDRTFLAQHGLFMEQLNAAEQAQMQHLMFIDRFVHQMKTPLSVIDLTAQQLDEPESSSMREETERMKNGLETVLYAARMRRIERDLHIQQVHLEQLIHEVNKENKRLYIRNEVYPVEHIETENLYVETDEKWLFFMMNQLIQNAVKYSAGNSNRIELSVEEEEGRAVFSVKDHGVGIPLHDQKRIFNAFYTGDNGRKFRESTGMGLYLVAEVANYMGHTVEVESRTDRGSLFSIHFTREQTMIRT